MIAHRPAALDRAEDASLGGSDWLPHQAERGSAGQGRQQYATGALIVIAMIGSLAALHAAARVVAPLLLSVLCALLLAPPVNWLTRRHVPRVLASALVMSLLLVLLGLVLQATWQPARSWLHSAPSTMAAIEKKLRPVQSLFQELDHVGREAERFSGSGVEPKSAAVSSGLPMTAITIMPGVAMSLVTSLAFVFLLLATGPRWLERIKASVNQSRQRQVVLLVETLRTELSRYLVTIAAIGVVIGAATTLLVHAFGVPNALLWGTMAGVLSLIPYFGSIVTLAVLTVVGLVTFNGLAPVLGMSGSFLLLEIIEGQFIQPILVGRRLELNPVAVVLAIWLLGALWGVSGVILSVPLLLALKATASHIPALHMLLPVIGCMSAPSPTQPQPQPQPHPGGYARWHSSIAAWRRRTLSNPAGSRDEVVL